MADFCVNCGSPIGEGVKFCPSCGKDTETPTTAQTSEQPNTAPSTSIRDRVLQGNKSNPLKSDNVNEFIWLLAIMPIAGFGLELCVGLILKVSVGVLWFITLALNIAVSFLDEKRLKRLGVDTKDFGNLAFVVPVYLFKRATTLNEKYTYAITWCASYALVIIASTQWTNYLVEMLFY